MNDAGRGHPRDGLSDYLDDELSVEARAAIDRHLAECEDCRAELDALRRLARAVASEPVPPVPLDLQARIGRRLDAATGVRLLRRRLFIPTSIAATIAAIGILVAIQWREGRLATPPPPEPQGQAAATDELKTSNAPVPRAAVAPDAEVARPQEKNEEARRDLLDKDLKEAEAPTPEQRQKQKADEGALENTPRAAGVDTAIDAARERVASKVAAAPSAAVPGGVQGGVVGGVEGGAPGGVSRCAEHWSDSGLRGTWEVSDVDAAVRDLERIARDVSGVSEWRGIADGRPYVLIVPRKRFEEVFYSLRARGVAGLDAPPELAAGNDCAGIAVTLTVVPAAPPR